MSNKIQYKQLINGDTLNNKPGIYLMSIDPLKYAINDLFLPEKTKEFTPIYYTHNSKRYYLLYIGISWNLKKRDTNQHVNGTARRSTFRKSLGVLILKDWKVEQLKNRKWKFTNECEDELTEKIHDSITLFYANIEGLKSRKELEDIEKMEINEKNPILNLSKIDEKNMVNIKFKIELKKLRRLEV